MKTFLLGYLFGVLSVILYVTRNRWFPWTRTKAQREVDKLISK